MEEEVIRALKRVLKEVGAGRLRPAPSKQLKLAKEYGFPNELIEFYRSYEPHGYVELSDAKPGFGAVRLLSIADALEANFYAMPGVGVFPQGYVVFAETNGGDAYCMDTNAMTSEGQHPVAIFGHEVIDDKTDPAYIDKSRWEVASCLEDFLIKFINGTLDDSPFYPRMNLGQPAPPPIDS
jgi:hypothetical protein